MLSKEDNELLTRVGPGTPMGELMRRFWIPALMSKELVADGEPIRLVLLGEKLIGFRDTNGRVGIMDHECPHRLASLFYGRNEEGGLRCIYHGWKFDVDGNCLDMANVPPHQDFKDKVKAGAYQVQERNGIIWLYMGKDKAPGLPEFPVCMHPEEELNLSRMQADCNWLQVIEGDQDTSHAGFLHSEKAALTNYQDDPSVYWMYASTSPEYEVIETDWGTMYGAYRPAGDGEDYWRVANFCFPFWSSGRQAMGAGISARVPMDDTHTMHFQINRASARRKQWTVLADPSRNRDGDIYLPNTTDWYGHWRLKSNVGNDHGIDRELQRTGNFSGILGIGLQDNAVQESMGPIEKRWKEHLAPSDRMIMVTRRRLLDAVRKFQETGEAPLIASHPEIYGKLAGIAVVTPKNLKLMDVWQQFALPNMLAKQALTVKAAE